MKRILWQGAALAALLTTQAGAVPVIDGTADAEYGSALSTQTTNTQFGNTQLGDLIATNMGGSEIDQVFGKVVGDRLYVTIAGNLEKNFNKIEVFLDTKAGGSQTLIGSNVPDQVDGFCCGNTAGAGALQQMDGLTFDAGFAPDYYLTFTHGNENLGNAFWAMSAHWADLSKPQGDPTGRAAAGMQLGPQGLPVVLRFPYNADFTNDAIVDGADVLVWQRNNGTTSGAVRTTGDATADGIVDSADLDQFAMEFGQVRSLADGPFIPNGTSPPTTALIGPTLPDLAQGDLIDKNYVAAHSPGGVPIAAELAFADAANRNMENTVGLKMAINNSNAAGVVGDGPYELATTDTNGDTRPAGTPQNVITGIEFSIPLSSIGNTGPGGTIKLTAFVNGTSHDFASNQFAGAGILQGNPGSPAFLDLSVITGDQFVSIAVPAPGIGAVPEPGAFALAALALAGAACRRRR